MKQIMLRFMSAFLLLAVFLPTVYPATVQKVTLEGVVKTIIVSSENSQNRIVVQLDTNDGKTYEIVQKPGTEKVFKSGTRVSVGGTLNGDTIFSDLITPTQTQQTLLGPGRSGPQRTFVFMLKFSDRPQEPRTRDYITNLIFGSFPSMKTLWEENSYNMMTIENQGVYGWFTLPYSEGYYSHRRVVELTEQALTIAYNSANVRLEDNDRLILILNGCNQCAAATFGYGGFDTPYGPITISVAWASPQYYTGAQDIRGIGTMFGFNLEFSQSGNVYEYYDSPWDFMSVGCSPEGGNTIIDNKWDWLLPPYRSVIQINAPVSDPLEVRLLPATERQGIRAIKINTALENWYYTVENRQRSGHDSCLPNEGIIIHSAYHLNNPFDVKPIDSTPEDNDLSNAQWIPGMVYNNPSYGFAVHVVSQEPDGSVILRITPAEPGPINTRPDFPDVMVTENSDPRYRVATVTKIAIASDGSSGVLYEDNLRYLQGQSQSYDAYLKIYDKDDQLRSTVYLPNQANLPRSDFATMYLFGLVADNNGYYYAAWSVTTRVPDVNDWFFLAKIRASDGNVEWIRGQEVTMPSPRRGWLMFDEPTQDMIMDANGYIHIVSKIYAGEGNAPLYYAKIDSTTGNIIMPTIIDSLDREFEGYSLFLPKLAADPTGRDPALYMIFSQEGGIGGWWAGRLYLMKLIHVNVPNVAIQWQSRIVGSQDIGWPEARSLVFSTNGKLYAFWSADSQWPQNYYVTDVFANQNPTFPVTDIRDGNSLNYYGGSMAVDGNILDIVYSAYHQAGGTDCYLNYLQVDASTHYRMAKKKLSGEGSRAQAVAIASRNGKLDVARTDGDAGTIPSADWCGTAGHGSMSNLRVIKSKYTPIVVGPDTVASGSSTPYTIYALRDATPPPGLGIPPKSYLTALTFGTAPGIILPDGRIVPMNPDDLFFISLIGLPLLDRNVGVIDSNGNGRVTLNVPNDPALSNLNVFLGGVTHTQNTNIVSSIMAPKRIHIA